MTAELKEILEVIYKRLSPEYWISVDLESLSDMELLLCDADESLVLYSQNQKAFYKVTSDGGGGLTAKVGYF